jgi:hypothetical protein
VDKAVRNFPELSCTIASTLILLFFLSKAASQFSFIIPVRGFIHLLLCGTSPRVILSLHQLASLEVAHGPRGKLTPPMGHWGGSATPNGKTRRKKIGFYLSCDRTTPIGGHLVVQSHPYNFFFIFYFKKKNLKIFFLKKVWPRVTF